MGIGYILQPLNNIRLKIDVDCNYTAQFQYLSSSNAFQFFICIVFPSSYGVTFHVQLQESTMIYPQFQKDVGTYESFREPFMVSRY